MAIIDIVKYEGSDSSFVWKHPCEDFNTFSQLIVNENQEAIFFSNGEALDLFGPGRYTLKTQNIPLLTGALKLVTGGKSPFHCSVFFINKSEEMALKWGTDSKLQVIEPVFGTKVSIGASGDMSVRVADSRKLLIKLVGTDEDFTHEELQDYFRAFISMRVKTYLAHLIKTEQMKSFELDSNLEAISQSLKAQLQDDFLDYGLELEQFFVTKIVRTEGEDEYDRMGDMFFEQENGHQPGADRYQFCDHCGARLAADSMFCAECGTPVPNRNNRCSKCGYVFTRPGKFCPMCGTRRTE